MATDDWWSRAVCKEAGVEMTPSDVHGVTEAKKVCFRCPVRKECLEFALGHRESFGVWGGMSERERRNERKRRAVMS